MFNFLGFFNIFFIIANLKWLSSLDNTYSFAKKPISALAKNKDSKARFILIMTIFTLLQLIYALYVIDNLNITHKLTINRLLIIGGILLVCSSLVVANRIILHRKLVQASVAFITLGVIMLSIQILSINKLVGVSILVSTTVLLMLQHILRNILKVGYWELPLLFMVIFWNIATTLLLK